MPDQTTNHQPPGSLTLSRTLRRAWLWLAGLSAGSAATAQITGPEGVAPMIAGTLILGLALLKARIILSRYLGLDRAPGWLAGFMWVIGIWGAAILALYLVPGAD